MALYLGLVLLAPVWLAYLWWVPKARAGFHQKRGVLPPALRARLAQREYPQRIWFHAVSVGEFNAIKTLIPGLRESFDVVISTTTRTGHDLAERTFPDIPVLYFPFDFAGVVRGVIRQVAPDLMVITETELWPNFTRVMTREFGVPLLLINGRLSARSYRGYRWVQWLMRPVLQQMSHLYMQSQNDADRIQALGNLAPEQMTVAGNLKFDLLPTVDPTRRAILARLLNIQPEDTVLTCASTHSGEDEFLLDAYMRLKKDFPELKLVLAPRHPERLKEIQGMLNSKAVHYAVRSQLNEENPNRQDVVVLDSIGELLTVYSMSTVAVMGGSFVERGGQNPLEPLSQRVPVVFGPHMANFAEISRMILDCGAGSQVSDQETLVNALTELLTQPELYDNVAETGQQLIENNRGAKAVIETAIRRALAERC